jgi:hypothetical protein
MADVKISGLPASTVPLAGTEVLPLVQGGTTKQVSIANVTAGRAIAATSITTDTYKAASSSGGALQNSGGTPQLQWGAGGGNNLSVDVAININPANAAVAISPTGTGTVAISPAGALTINPTAASTINNTSIGAATASTGRFTTVTSTIATGTAPLVVASTTEVANLRAANATSADTANQVKSNATTGVLQVAGPGTGTTRVMTTPDANFTAARTDAAQTFTGDQTFGTVLATTFDTNVAAAGVTLAGTTLAADGTDTNIDVNITPKGSGKTQFTNMTRTTLSEGVMQELYSTSTAIFTGSQIAKTDIYGNDGGEAIVAYQDWRAAGNHSPNSRDMSLYIGLARSNTQTAGDRLFVLSSGSVRPSADNSASLGAASNRWSEVFAGNGTINTSDAREKTAVRQFTDNEIAAAKQLGSEIGMFKFLASVEEKGDSARNHIGMTVQRAIEIMTSHGLDPMAYGFICYDEWDDIIHQAATDTQEAVIQPAGNRFSFRSDQLLFFIARGFEARLSALESTA